ncbi:MAG TPA: gluconokinase [Actinophytocola sp.]|uniref:gluconokinase n=1 Tax=Actinophytocola sp. TaxID=1872138 RepID=UPI002DDD50B3|nr:gluconokinase [Actinophytocola sp.]HEV2778151.1 gluconokinase [Actinophytocola sp.]
MNPVVVVMGVSGSGKTTIGRALAERLGVPYAEADEFHPRSNIDKMSAGRPLTDADRWPWLRAIASWIRSQPGGAVVTCSALKRAYRDHLHAAAPDRVRFLHLSGDRDLIAARLSARSAHFMPASLLDSQLADLEPLSPDEPGLTLDISAPPATLVTAALQALRPG